MNELPLDQVDILVVGGGMAGCMAAMAAKKKDNRVLLVEPSNVLGGQGTAGGVAGFCGDTLIHNHLFRELVARLEAHGLIMPYDPLEERLDYDLEWCAFFLQEMVLERGVEVFLHSRVLDAVSVDGRISKVSIATSSDVMTVAPQMVIDASGRCIIPHKAGFETIHEGANHQLPMSLYFTLWDTGKPVQPILPPGCPTWKSEDDLPMTSLHIFPSGKVEVKLKIVGFDAADGADLSRAETFARRQMMGLIYYLQTVGYGKHVLNTHVLASVSRGIGIREERRIVGEHILTEEEITHTCVFDDAVAVGTFHLDYHWPDIAQRAGTGITTMVEPHHIPLRCFIPRGAKNLLVPGRGASGDQMAMSSYRVMATVAQMGFAAGVAARHALDRGSDLSAVDIKALRSEIEASGQVLDLSKHGHYMRNGLLVREMVFEEAPFQECHASTLVQLSNARILTAWFAGTKERNPDTAIWIAERFESRWSQPRLLAKVNDQAHWNPVLFAAPDGRVLLWFKVGPNAFAWKTYAMSSSDEGVTWSQPELVQPDHIWPRGPQKNKPILLSDGALLAPASLELPQPDGGELWQTFIDRSEDDGRTWQCSEVLSCDETIGYIAAIQPTLWESQPGRVHMLLRTDGGYIGRSDSNDGGRTWCPIYRTDLPNNNSGLDVAKLDGGTLALVFNPIAGSEMQSKTRGTLCIALSFDNGHTWPRRLNIENEPGVEYSYPAIIPTRLGMAITYTWQRQCIAFWHGSIERIPEYPSHD